MVESGSYRELNAAKEGGTPYALHLAVVNGWGDFNADSMMRLVRDTESSPLKPRITMIDLLGTFGDSEKLHLFLVAFPQVRIFLPADPGSPAEVLNLFLKECRAEKVALLPCDLALEKLDPVALAAAGDRPVLAALPLVRIGGQVQESGLAWKAVGSSLEIMRFTPMVGDLSAGPWHGAALYERRTLLDLGGFDPSYKTLFSLHLDLWLRAAEAGLESPFVDGFAFSGSPTHVFPTDLSRREIDLVKASHFVDLVGDGLLGRRGLSALIRGSGEERKAIRRAREKRQERKAMRTFDDRALLARLQGSRGFPPSPHTI